MSPAVLKRFLASCRALALLAVLAAPPVLAGPCDPGDGMGGTGVSANVPGDGDGMGGTGIYGVVTGFGSVCVNGLEVQYDDATPVQRNGEPASARILRVGQVVAIEAHGRAAELRARSIAVLDDLVGTMTAADTGRGEMQVLGQPVRVGRSTIFEGAPGPGQTVRVSGLRDALGTLHASRIERAEVSEGLVSVRGPVERDRGVLTVGGVPVGGMRAVQLAPGSTALVTGRWDGATLRAERSLRDPAREVLERAGRVEMQVVPRSGFADGMVLRGRIGRDGDLRVEGARLFRPERSERPQGVEKPEKPEKREGAERLERLDRPERVERPERAQRPERIERPERSERESSR